jgi:hypothetical protein
MITIKHRPMRDFLPLSPDTASPTELAEALNNSCEFDATLRACARQLGRVAQAEAQAGITALFNGVKP